MASLTKRRPIAQHRNPETRDGVEMTSHTIGHALVVYPKDRMSAELRTFALGLAPDPDHELVVVDVPAGSPFSLWESAAELMPRKRKGLRLVIGGRSRETTALAGQWLAERLGRPVLAPDGAVVPGVGGSLFVDGGDWVRFQSGKPPRPEAKRFPRPSWESPALAETVPTSSTGIAEPLPGGVWLRPASPEPQLRVHRARLLATLPCQPEVCTIVLGCPGAAPVNLDDVARFWRGLPSAVRARARLVRFGPVSNSDGMSYGQALANAFGESVVCYAGLPVGSRFDPAIYTVQQDGTLGWRSFAEEFGYAPQQPGRVPPPCLLRHRAPVQGVPEISPAVYWYAPDAVVEVVQAGLWLRPPYEVAHGPVVRSAAAEAGQHLLLFEAGTAEMGRRMRLLAEDVLARLDDATRRMSGVVPATAVTRVPIKVIGRAMAELEPAAPAEIPAAPEVPEAPKVVEAPAPVLPEAPLRLESAPVPDFFGEEPVEEPVAVEIQAVFAPTPSPSPSPEPVVAEVAVDEVTQVQPTPSTAAAALVPKRGLDEERSWLRRTLSREYATVANSVARVLSEHPGFQGALARSSGGVLTDAVAVRLYLSAEGDQVDLPLRLAEVGPHVPFARCVVSGLSRLPSHRGATVFAASPTPEQWELYRSRKLFSEWGFVNALTAPCGGQQGDTDVLMWSMSARRTKLLEPETDPTPDRVLFVPGTSFKVLDVTEPADGKRGQILLRELATGEIDADGRVDGNRVSLDELAISSLRRCAETWASAEHKKRIAESATARFRSLPGLVQMPRAEGDS
ncbi:hypothetical protein [Allokutzneria albata]|uniref:Protein TonB, links inner and outer membranes n=1 Tax=Allokutzneria albata TaxID=211114 RepID=A0A1G9WAR0_ALLAB|nr:hypothetical protein [Allokutzneria albata]SDM81363.1 protein TonB, links inner and outer membranes [Allokutzneria albata]